MSKTTSLAALTEALTQFGWTFETTQTEVVVPDPDSPDVRYSRYSGRATYMPTKRVPGVVVTASNKTDERFESKNLTAHFTADGKYLGQHTKGSYPFNINGISLKKMLTEVERYAPEVLSERKRAQAEQRAQEQAEYDAKVLVAHAEAKEALTASQNVVYRWLMDEVGLNDQQAVNVLVEAQNPQGRFTEVLKAKTAVERTGKGWLPGSNFLTGTYVDGVRVSSDDED